MKVQDGCSFACSYCVIPQVRGPSRSRAGRPRSCAEVARRAAQGHREVVLTGINLGCFRDRAAGMRLADLIVAVAGVAGIERVRLSSIEVNHLTDALLDALTHPGVAAHLHVPMQSGDDARAAARCGAATPPPGSSARMERARTRVAGREPDERRDRRPSRRERGGVCGHAATRPRAAGFTKVHVFPYSPRPGTADGGRAGVAAAVKRRRSRRAAGASPTRAAPRTARPSAAGASACWSRPTPGAATATT